MRYLDVMISILRICTTETYKKFLIHRMLYIYLPTHTDLDEARRKTEVPNSDEFLLDCCCICSLDKKRNEQITWSKLDNAPQKTWRGQFAINPIDAKTNNFIPWVPDSGSHCIFLVRTFSHTQINLETIKFFNKTMCVFNLT